MGNFWAFSGDRRPLIDEKPPSNLGRPLGAFRMWGLGLFLIEYHGAPFPGRAYGQVRTGEFVGGRRKVDVWAPHLLGGGEP
jgi:hypothetical protein